MYDRHIATLPLATHLDNASRDCEDFFEKEQDDVCDDCGDARTDEDDAVRSEASKLKPVARVFRRGVGAQLRTTLQTVEETPRVLQFVSLCEREI